MRARRPDFGRPMKKHRKQSALVCVLALLGLLGCNDDDPAGVIVDPIDVATAEDALQQSLEEVVLPVLALFGFVAQLAQAPAPVGGGGEGLPCEGGGSYTIGELDIQFSDCIENGVVIDGLFVITDPAGGTVTFNLTVGGALVIGDGTLVPMGNCGPGFTFAEFGIETEELVAELGGTLEQCEGTFPEGLLTLTVAGSFGDLEIEITFDGSADVTAILTDRSAGMVAATCSATLLPVVDATCS
jgi:hypothetical protein